MFPAAFLEQLTTSVVHFDAPGFTDDETLRAGQELALAVMPLLVWDSHQ